MTGVSKKFDLEKIVSIEAIRAHTKSLDIPTVTDEQLILYRESAFEAAERYIGMKIGPVEVITESVESRNDPRRPTKVRLTYPPVDGVVQIHLDGLHPSREYVDKKGGRSLTLPVIVAPLSWNNCCSPCSTQGSNGRIRGKVMYRAGRTCEDDVPAGVVVGVLRYIQYQISNPGDIAVAHAGGISQTAPRTISNNVVLSSGAAAEWDRYRVVT